MLVELFMKFVNPTKINYLEGTVNRHADELIAQIQFG